MHAVCLYFYRSGEQFCVCVNLVKYFEHGNIWGSCVLFVCYFVSVASVLCYVRLSVKVEVVSSARI